MRTPQQAIRDAMPAIQAYGEGKQIQVQIGGREWNDFTAKWAPEFGDPDLVWRPKPEPKPPVYRPWTTKDVPRGFWVRHKATGNEYQIVAVEQDRAPVGIGSRGWLRLEELLESYVLINPDGTESPCGVEVPQ